jgi:hypothetical protein
VLRVKLLLGIAQSCVGGSEVPVPVLMRHWKGAGRRRTIRSPPGAPPVAGGRVHLPGPAVPVLISTVSSGRRSDTSVSVRRDLGPRTPCSTCAARVSEACSCPRTGTHRRATCRRFPRTGPSSCCCCRRNRHGQGAGTAPTEWDSCSTGRRRRRCPTGSRRRSGNSRAGRPHQSIPRPRARWSHRRRAPLPASRSRPRAPSFQLGSLHHSCETV